MATEISDEDMSFIIRNTTELLRVEYREFHEVPDSMLSLIDRMASLVITNYVRFDYEFMNILYLCGVTDNV